MAKGGNPNLPHRSTGCDAPKTLPEMVLTRNQSSKYQQLADAVQRWDREWDFRQ
jgi:hypothetical protein